MDYGIGLVGLGGGAERGVSAVAVGLRTSRARSSRRGADAEYVRAHKGRWESTIESSSGLPQGRSSRGAACIARSGDVY